MSHAGFNRQTGNAVRKDMQNDQDLRCRFLDDLNKLFRLDKGSGCSWRLAWAPSITVADICLA